MTATRVLVTGSRLGCAGPAGDPMISFASALWSAGLDESEIVEVVHGGARGVDREVQQWAISHGIPERGMGADWVRFGRGAGPIRNQEMVDYCARCDEPWICLAFPGPSSRGTWDCVRRAHQAGAKVYGIDGEIRPRGDR